MADRYGRGNFINGSFLSGSSISFNSQNPSKNLEPVFFVNTELEHVDQAVASAKNAQKSWAYLGQSARCGYLERLSLSFKKNEEALAQAISLEMGKIFSEAMAEAKSLSARIDLVINHGLSRIASQELFELRALTRYHQQGTLAVIGPYNFPAHLVNAHVIPALLTGNTVVVKPSEVCPMTAEIYAQCFLEAELPSGVYNMVQGDGAFGKALSSHPLIDGVLFTGSYKTGRALSEMLLDQPQKILALEMGGKNIAVIMQDADPNQALKEVILGAFLTTGQRCTATSRVLVHEKLYNDFAKALCSVTKKLQPSDAFGPGLFGPLASRTALERFMQGLSRAQKEGARSLVESQELQGGALVTPSVYEVAPNHPLDYYLGEELFGPNLAIEPFKDLGQAIDRVNESPFGLSNSIFSLSPHHAEVFYQETKSGVLNINRGTNGAHGQMPFGGLGMSGNQRAAGIDAVRYTTYPVAISSLAYGESSTSVLLTELLNEENLKPTPLPITVLTHDIERLFELYGLNSDLCAQGTVIFSRSSFANTNNAGLVFFDELKEILGKALSLSPHHLTICVEDIANAPEAMIKLRTLLSGTWRACGLNFGNLKALAINIPEGMRLPRSRAMLDRLYSGNFVPAEKKSLVADLNRSKGPYLVSVDEDPLILFDAASQISTLGAGFFANTFQKAYHEGSLDEAIQNTWDLSMEDDDSSLCADALLAKKRFEKMLHEKSPHPFASISYGASGAEANEIAIDLCRQNGPGGTRIVVFEGSFHGRTIISLQATYNKEKRGPFVFKGYEASFVPFPTMANPQNQPEIDEALLAELGAGKVIIRENADELLKRELKSLSLLKEEIEKGNMCCVMVEPMQCEGGDNYASNRFFKGLRALTRALNIPLVFDEVQTGFHLGRTFFWHEQFGLSDGPDCLSLAKKAQLGVCMSRWTNPRRYAPHVLQLKRGLLHASAITTETALQMENIAYRELLRLEQCFPTLVKNSRACGFAFAFDMPSNKEAMELVNQRFERGFMVYIAGEKTLRFRLNMCTNEQSIIKLFERLFLALIDMREGRVVEKYRILKNPKRNAHLSDLNFEVLTAQNFDSYAPSILAIEKVSYEEGRRDSYDSLLGWLKQKDSLGLVLKLKLDDQEILAGYAIGAPLEHAQVDGPHEDPLLAHNHTFYSANITLDQRVRGMRLGRLLKNEQIKRVASLKDKHGNQRYTFMAGRNRVGVADSMTRINEELGAYSVKIYDRQYGDDKAKALYYRLPLNKERHIENCIPSSMINAQNSVHMPVSKAPASFKKMLSDGELGSLACQKLTLSNWATPNMIRYSELLRKMMPQCLKHAYFTSGRDEIVDKGLRSLRFHRLDADIAISFSHQWLGHTSAAARSLSHDESEAQPFGFFNWPKISHPKLVGNEQSLDELSGVLKNYASEQILGIVVELCGERSALDFDESFLGELDSIRLKNDIPLVFVETASAYGRSGRSIFLSDSIKVKPNMVWWYTGGQLGHVFVDDRYFVEKPLTLISTWDGDDMSMARAYHNLLCAESWTLRAREFEAMLQNLPLFGMGLWRGLKLNSKEQLSQLKAKMRDQGILIGTGFDNTAMICPKVDSSTHDLELLAQALEKSI